MRNPSPGGRRELCWMAAVTVVAILAVLRPDLYAAAAQGLATAVVGHH
ncbi:hypothetical protein ACIRQQ_35265 [Streptomyces fuscichromogenes]